MKEFGPRLRQLREKRGLTQQDVALAIGTDWTQVSRYERGVHLPAADKLLALARVLRVTPDTLLLGDRKGEQPISFQNIRLYERFLALDQLPRDDQDVVLRLVDAVLAKHKLEHLASEVRRPA